MNVKVGVAVFALGLDSRFIIGKRKGSHGAGTWGLPGGHLEYGETFESCARREFLEETGLEIEQIRFLTATNDPMVEEGKHYVTLFFAAKLCDGNAQPKVMEPDKCEEWQMVTWSDILEDWLGFANAKLDIGSTRKPLFKPLLSMFEQCKGFSPLDSTS